jgi:hypothetical protein
VFHTLPVDELAHRSLRLPLISAKTAWNTSQLGEIDMAETPQDFTRAEDTVLNLSDNFAAKAKAKT